MRARFAGLRCLLCHRRLGIGDPRPSHRRPDARAGHRPGDHPRVLCRVWRRARHRARLRRGRQCPRGAAGHHPGTRLLAGSTGGRSRRDRFDNSLRRRARGCRWRRASRVPARCHGVAADGSRGQGSCRARRNRVRARAAARRYPHRRGRASVVGDHPGRRRAFP